MEPTLIKKPTQELLDDYLLELNNTINEFNEQRAKKEASEKRFNDLVDELLHTWEEKQKTKAEARIRQEQKEGCKKMHDIYVETRTIEREVKRMTINYYHARSKLEKAHQIDVLASQHWQHEDFVSWM